MSRVAVAARSGARPVAIAFDSFRVTRNRLLPDECAIERARACACACASRIAHARRPIADRTVSAVCAVSDSESVRRGVSVRVIFFPAPLRVDLSNENDSANSELFERGEIGRSVGFIAIRAQTPKSLMKPASFSLEERGRGGAKSSTRLSNSRFRD